MKKIISFLLVLATIMSCLVLSISANAPTGAVRSDEGLLPFEDVKDSHWFAKAVEFCYSNEIIKGMNEYTFGFSGQLTRAQFVTMLANLENVDTSAYSVSKFTDVKSSHWYYGAIAWAYEKGIVNGMTDTTFAPNGVLTRAQLATVMKNYMEGKYEVEVKDDVLNKFTDKPKDSYWYYGAMKYAVSAELLSGNSDGTLAPTGTVTRAQAAVIFKSFMEKYFYGACEHAFSEADCTNASTCEKCGLKNGLPYGHKVVGYTCEAPTTCLECNAEVAPSNIYHSFRDATCTEPRTCSACGATRGEALGHKWKAATCTAPKTCTVCKATEGSAKGHNFKAATCTEPKVCVVCNTKEGSALGHTTTTGTCGRCGKVFGTFDYDKMANLIKSKGSYVVEGNSYVLVTEDSDSATGVAYYLSENFITIEYFRGFSNGHLDTTIIYIEKGSTVYDYVYMYANESAYIFAGYGLLDPSTFTKNTKEGFSEYEGTLKSSYTDYMNSALKEMLNDTNKLLKSYGYSVKDLGFKAY